MTIKEHCPLLPDIQCLENCCFIHFVSFVILGERKNHIPVTSSWLEVGSLLLTSKCDGITPLLKNLHFPFHSVTAEVLMQVYKSLC